MLRILALALATHGVAGAQVVHNRTTTHPIPEATSFPEFNPITVDQVPGATLGSSWINLRTAWSCGPQAVTSSWGVTHWGAGLLTMDWIIDWPGGKKISHGGLFRWFDEQDIGPGQTVTFYGEGTAINNCATGPYPDAEGLGTAEISAFYASTDLDWQISVGPPVVRGPDAIGNWWADFATWSIDGTLWISIDFIPWPLDQLDAATYCQSAPNSTGQTTLLTAGGSNSIADDALYFSVENLPTGVLYGHLIVSANQANIPLFGGGEGTLCLNAPITRVLPSIAKPNELGQVAVKYDLDPGFSLQPGDVLNFQWWHRDEQSLGFHHNTSNGLAVTFD